MGRAADADLDVDDIVQETMLHVVTGLPGLRDATRVATRSQQWVPKPVVLGDPGILADQAVLV
jgi:hypothetical protein